MTQQTKRERVDAALRGEPIDRVPVSAWLHFIPEERTSDGAVNAHGRFFRDFDWDWLKVNPRATYYAEAWGNRYDYDHYDGVLPQRTGGPIATPADLAKIEPVSATEGVFGEELNVLWRIGRGLGGAHFVQTVFSPLSVLAFLATQPGNQLPDLGLQSSFDGLRRLIHEHPREVHAALAAIAETLHGYADAVLETGASGVFFAIVRLARAGVLTPSEYEAFGKPYDLRVLQAVQSAPFNLLHVCGPQAYFDLARDYPVHAVNWAAVGQGNPTLAEARARTTKALIGGVDEAGAIQSGTPADVLAEARTAIASVGATKLLLSPGCGLATNVPAANLHALRQAVEAYGGQT